MIRFSEFLYIACILLLPVVASASAPADTALKPNIIFILADDLGYGDVGVFGQQKINTPHIDRLAIQGMRFTQFYAGTSVCAPSRSSFMTGQHTGHTPIRSNKELKPEGQWPLKLSAITIPEVMKTAGYATGVFGKWGLGFIGTEGDPNNQGVDEFYGYNCQRQSHNFYPTHLWNNDKRIDLNNSPASQNEYSADIIHNKALTFIEKNSKNPFFVCLTYTLPHAALQIPKDDEALKYYQKLFKEKPVAVNDSAWIARGGTGYQPTAYPKSTYAAMVAKLDSYVGEVVQKLKLLNIDKNTVIVFASDNGPHMEGGNNPHFFNSSGGLRGTKRDLYEGGIRTPFIAKWPGQIVAGTTSAHIGAFWDLLPTFAELGGAQWPQNIDGISIVPVMLGKAGQKQHRYLYWEFHELGGRQAVRLGNWKGVKYTAAENPNSPIQLYNLWTDRAEQNDIAGQHPEIVKKIAEVMQQQHVENPDFPFFKK